MNYTKRIESIIAIQRKTKKGYKEWLTPLSQELIDWYSPHESISFHKNILEFTSFVVVIEATEFADVLMTSGVAVAQGVEDPLEMSETYSSSCGQSTVMPFVISYDPEPFLVGSVPSGDAGGISMKIGDLSWEEAWTYRRTKTTIDDKINPNNDTQEGDIPNTIMMLDVSNQNFDNDYTNGYIFLSGSSNKEYEKLFDPFWAGGINLTTLSGAENRSYAYYHYVRGHCHDQDSSNELCDDKKPPVEIRPYLALNNTQVHRKKMLRVTSCNMKYVVNMFRLVQCMDYPRCLI